MGSAGRAPPSRRSQVPSAEEGILAPSRLNVLVPGSDREPFVRSKGSNVVALCGEPQGRCALFLLGANAAITDGVLREDKQVGRLRTSLGGLNRGGSVPLIMRDDNQSCARALVSICVGRCHSHGVPSTSHNIVRA
jgi:hypothetical protein